MTATALTPLGASALTIALLLAVSGLAKLLDRDGAGSAAVSVIGAVLMDTTKRQAIWRALASAEVVLGVAILVWPVSLAIGGAALWLVASAALLVWAIRAAPGRRCGCFGSLSVEPVGRRTVIRTAAAAGLAVAAALAPGGWPAALGSPAGWPVFVLSGVLLVALSPESRSIPALAQRRAPRACRHHMPVERLLRDLSTAPEWRDLERYLPVLRPTDQWTEGSWRFVRLDARFEGRAVAAVVALRMREPREWRGAVVDEHNERVLFHVAGPAAAHA